MEQCTRGIFTVIQGIHQCPMKDCEYRCVDLLTFVPSVNVVVSLVPRRSVIELFSPITERLGTRLR